MNILKRKTMNFQLIVKGSRAFFGDHKERISKPILTPLAAKEILHNLCYLGGVTGRKNTYVIDEIDCISPVQYTMNPIGFHSGVRKVLKNVEYVIHFHLNNVNKADWKKIISRMRNKNYSSRPYLGDKQFLADCYLLKEGEHAPVPVDWSQMVHVPYDATRIFPASVCGRTYEVSYMNIFVDHGVMDLRHIASKEI